MSSWLEKGTVPIEVLFSYLHEGFYSSVVTVTVSSLYLSSHTTGGDFSAVDFFFISVGVKGSDTSLPLW